MDGNVVPTQGNNIIFSPVTGFHLIILRNSL